MSDSKNLTEAVFNSSRERQYTAGSSTRHRSSSGTRRRLLFFGLASIWGFIVGVVGLLAAVGAEGQQLVAGANALPALIPAALLAVAGGLIVATAYREAKRRAR